MSTGDPTFNLQRAFDGVHERLNDIASTVTEVDTKMHSLVGNGQPGRVGVLEKDVEELKGHANKAKGYFAALAAVSTVLGGLLHYIIDLVKHK